MDLTGINFLKLTRLTVTNIFLASPYWGVTMPPNVRIGIIVLIVTTLTVLSSFPRSYYH